ncbi:hypothetical protein ACRBEV_32525 [Methylobacterium phyllosphaerae]
MISVSTDSYLALLHAAQLQAARTGLPLDDKQSVPVAVEEQAPPPAPENTSNIVRVVDVLV